MKLKLAKILYILGDFMCKISPYDITSISYFLYQKFMLKSIDLDTDKVIWKDPADAKNSLKVKLKL